MDIEVDAIIPLARPAIGEAEISAVSRALLSGRLVMGRENQRFEAALANLSGRAHAVCLSSGTTALELALWALGVSTGDEVLVPAAGFPAAANAALRLGAMPVPVDIEPPGWTMDVGAAAQAVTGATRAVVSIDMLGVVAEAEPLRALCADAGLMLVDDAACALGGCDSRDNAGGGYGVVGTFSFHPRKLITTGEGGAVVCDDADLAAKLCALRNQGQTAPGQFAYAGTNARMGELGAALGCAQIDKLGRLLGERKLLVDGYRERLAPLRRAGTLSWQEAPGEARPAHQTFAVLLAPGVDRERVRARLRARGIESGVAAFAMSRLDSFAALPSVAGRRFPVAEALHERGLALPLFAGMRSTELDRVSDALTDALTDEVAEALT